MFMSFASSGSLAHAQAWLPDRNYTEGPGIRLGDVELHPGVVVRGGYDTNVFRADGERFPEESSAILAVTPHLNVSSLGRLRRAEGEDRDTSNALPTLGFRGGVSATYFHYFLDEGPKNLEADADFLLNILPQRPVSLDVGFGYLRSIRPFAQRRLIGVPAPTAVKADYIFNVVDPSIRLNFASRSRVLNGYVGYVPRVTIFESPVYDYLNNLQHSIQVGAGWKFLPSTALVYEAQLELQDYMDDFEETNSPVVLSNSKRFRTRLGLNGALTRKLQFRALAGYTAGFFDNGQLDDFEAAIGEAGIIYRFGPGQIDSFSLTYQRSAEGAALGGWVKLDRGSANLVAVLGRVFQLNLEAGAAYVTYGRLAGRLPVADRTLPGDGGVIGLREGGGYDRDDVRLDGAIRGEYRATNWLAFTADLTAQALITDFDYAAEVQGAGALPDPAGYKVFSAFGGVRFHY